MKWTLRVGLVVGSACSLALAISAQQPAKPIVVPTGAARPIGISETTRLDPQGREQGPVNLIGVIAVPGGLSSVDILWVDQLRGRLYLADRTNRGVDIFDAVNDVFIDRISGFVAISAPGNNGPNGVVVTPENILWVGDSNSTLQAVDLNLSPPRIIRSISVGSATDGRSDELAYDPVERVILVANDASKPPRVTFVSADSYDVLGRIDFPDAGGMEQPVWNTQLHRFLINVPASPAYVAVIDPTRMTVTKKYTVPNCSGGTNGLVLAPFQRMLVSACGRPYIMNAIDGHIINTITQVGGGDEVWYNTGDGRYYVTSADTTTGLQGLGVIDAETSTWVQNVPSPRLRNVAAFEGNNHIFAVATRPPATATSDPTVCASFGLVFTGCVAVFSHF